MIGRSFGDFVVRDKLGAGGAGEVFLAEQLSLGRQAVIKLIAAEHSASAAERFMREAQLASQLDHPFAAHIYGFGTENDGTMWIAMELVRGMSLQQMIAQAGPVPIARFVPFFDRLCEVLQAAHEQGIVHRDIKPHNVMVLSRAGRMLPKLLDLGVARGGGEVDAAGAVVGTPHYMSPEQWLQAESVDARSDLYCLTLLAYHALVGEVPYPGLDNVFALARAHTKRTLSALPEHLPIALNAVLQKGAAKAPGDRYQSALELGAAVRAASGIGDEPVALPQLDKALHDALVADAPQPLAEAAVLLECARSQKQAYDAIIAMRQVLLRYLAVLALAARGRVGAGAARDDERVLELLRRLAVNALYDAEWLELGRALCRPFSLRPAAHPLPELVAFYAETEDAFAALEASLQTAASDEQLLRALSALGRVLQKASFVFDYPLLLGDERWMGTRRAQRTTQVISGQPPEREPYLVDRLGSLVLTLAPLLQAVQPSGGMPEELFFLDGAGRHGARLLSLPGAFERHSDAVWPWFSRAIIDVTHERATAERDEKPPYKGLSAFTADDADSYYGREREAEEFANRLRVSRLLVVVGPSGVGKSSFVLAGVLPLLPVGCRAIVMRPGASPRLPELDTTNGEILLVIDQFEELVTLCQAPAERLAFAEAVVTASAQPRVRVVLTLRDDFLIKVQQLAPFGERLSSSLQLLATPAADDLLRVIVEPAKRTGYAFDDADLPHQMVAAVAEHPGALALLAFTASQLWELRDRELRQMRRKTYDALGGVGGALAHHAEATLAAMSDDERRLVREVFRHLVTASGTRAVLSRREMAELLGATQTAESVLEKLIVARLLVSSETGGDRIEIIHEALIACWPRLSDWLREDAETARFRDALRASARQWDERQRPRGLLWRAETLAEYKVWRMRYQGRLTHSEDAFAAASLADERRARHIRQSLLGAAFMLLSIALIIIWSAYGEAKQRLLALREEQARVALVAQRPLEALPYLHEAISGGADNASIQRMASLITYELAGSRGVVLQQAVGAYHLELSPDAAWVATFTGENNVGLASTAAGGARGLVQTDVPCTIGRFAKDRLIAGCRDGALRVIDVATRQVTRTVPVAVGSLFDLAVQGEAVLVSVAFTGVKRVQLADWSVSNLVTDTATPSLATRVAGQHVALFAAAMTDQQADTLHGLWLWDLQRRVATDTIVTEAVYSPDGARLLFGTNAGELGLVDTHDGRLLWRRNAHARPVRGLGFLPLGDTLVSAAGDGVAAWSMAGARRWSNPAQGSLSGVCFSSDGRRVFAVGDEAVLQTLDAETGNLLWRHHGHSSGISGCVATPDAVFSAGFDGALRAWQPDMVTAAAAAQPLGARELHIAPGASSAVVLAADGVWAWAPSGLRHVLREPIAPAQLTAVSASAENAAAVIVDDSLRIVDLASGVVQATQTLPDRALAVVIDAAATQVAALLANERVTVTQLREHTSADLVLEGESLTLGAFLGRDVFLTCSGSGLLVAWAVRSGKLLDRQAAHKTTCFADVDGDRIRTFSINEGGIVLWRWSGAVLERVGSLDTDFGGEVLGRGDRLDALSAQGRYISFSAAGLPLGTIDLRQDGFARSVADRSGFFFIDHVGRLGRFQPPEAVSITQIASLQRSRGVWDVLDGRLTRRTIRAAE